MVDLWRVSMGGPDPRLEAKLSAEEKARAGRFVRPDDRRRFVVMRGWLREILESYCGAPPVIVIQPGGKPTCAEVQFSLSHSGDWGLIAVSRSGDVGVDIEMIRPLEDMLGIATRMFDAETTKMIAGLTGDEQAREFFRHWTRREARVKAPGAACLEDLEAPPGYAAALARTAPGPVCLRSCTSPSGC